MANPKKRILIVDDEPDHRDLLKLLLLDVWALDVVVAEASHGQAAVEQTQQWHPQVILMDLLMPYLDGYEAIRQIRALETMQMASAETVQPLAPRISIIAVSAAGLMGGRSPNPTAPRPCMPSFNRPWPTAIARCNPQAICSAQPNLLPLRENHDERCDPSSG